MKTLQILIVSIFFSASILVPMDLDLATTKDPEVVKKAQQHNRRIPLITCPPKISEKIFSYVVDANQPMGRSIKNILAISATCRHFDDSLEWFGTFLKPYSNDDKNKVLARISHRLFVPHRYYGYEDKKKIEIKKDDRNSWRRSTLLIVSSGIADTQQSKEVLDDALAKNDTRLAGLLLKNGMSPYVISRSIPHIPVFFDIKQLDMAAVFAHHKVDFNQGSKYYPNVLWYCFIHKHYSDNFSELIQFYLNQGVNPALLLENGQCLLHCIANQFSLFNYEVRKSPYVNGVFHVLVAMKHQINTIDSEGNTPFDILCKKVNKEGENFPAYIEEMLPIVKQFRLAGAKKAQELKEKEQI
jgi:hypothetical protein